MEICIDSRKVKPGDAFYCIKGTADDGHKYIDSAIDNGAVLIVHQDELTTQKRAGVEYLKVEDSVDALNKAAAEKYGHPADYLKVYGATGTNGKTTITYLLSELLSRCAVPCGYIGTVGAKMGEHEYDVASLTTPDVVTLQRALSEMLRDGGKAVALEVSAQGVVQDRIKAIDFDYAIYTNLTHEHLDYFGTIENYFAAKLQFFTNLSPTATAILNADDAYCPRILEKCNCNTVTYAINSAADYQATNIEYRIDGMSFDIVHSGREYHVDTNLQVEYNVYNLLAVSAALNESGIPFEQFIPLFREMPEIPGRMTEIKCGQDFKVYIDYAHTPDAYEKLISYARNLPGDHKVYTVSGAAGKRDKSNRQLFGELIGKYADKAFLTADDPRDEDPADIAKEIAAHFPSGFEYEFIADRRAAVHAAISAASTGDIVLLLGKGCEDYIYVGDGKEPYVGDDVAAREAIESL